MLNLDLIWRKFVDYEGSIEAFDAAGSRKQVKIMIGGVIITQEYAEKTGADGYAANV